MLEIVIAAISQTYQLALIVSIIAAPMIVAVGSLYRNQAANIATAIILGFVVVTVPATLSKELWLNNTLWIVAAGLLYGLLERLRNGPELDVSRALSGVNRRRSARRTVASEVKRWRFEVES